MATSSARAETAQRNRLLAGMTPGDRALLAGLGSHQDLAPGQVLAEPGKLAEEVVFPESGLIAAFQELRGGGRAQVALIGPEGMIGAPALLGDEIARQSAVVQVGGRALVVPARAMMLMAEASRILRGLLRRYFLAMLNEVSLAAVCNAVHPVERRTARWILMAADRVGPSFPVTQEELAMLLGVRRPTMNAALNALKDAGLIRHVRGRIGIADRPGLEARACPCYRAGRDMWESLLPNSFG